MRLNIVTRSSGDDAMEASIRGTWLAGALVTYSHFARTCHAGPIEDKVVMSGMDHGTICGPSQVPSDRVSGTCYSAAMHVARLGAKTRSREKEDPKLWCQSTAVAAEIRGTKIQNPNTCRLRVYPFCIMTWLPPPHTCRQYPGLGLQYLRCSHGPWSAAKKKIKK